MTKTSQWAEGLGAACDDRIFLPTLKAWNEGMDVPLRDPRAPMKPGLYLTDIPINRGAMAAAKFLRGAGVDNPQAYLWRVMHLGEILRAAPALGLGELVRDDEVHTALLRAAAVAKLATRPADAIGSTEDCPVFDLADVAAKTREFLAAEEAAG
ncbi:MAG TPA: hypothetical protein VF522_19010 [Ramlibacter sp.]|uniref:hypothetical protein n=1 Tax=Ramlibacter sp. TaxID=1917967 RepID=UPI002ED5857D